MKLFSLALLVFATTVLSGCMSSAPEMVYNDRIISYTPASVVAANVSGHQVVLNFRADRCPSCNAFAQELLANQKNLTDTIRVIDVNYDTATDLKVQYAVTSQHTFVLLHPDGSQAAKKKGISTVSQLNTWVSENAKPVVVNDTNTDDMQKAISDTNPATATNDVPTRTMTVEKQDTKSLEQSSHYVAYSPAALQTAQNAGKKVVLFFAADRCPSCVSADKEFVQEQNTDLGFTLLKVDYDKETALKVQYGVTTQHTFVSIDASGTLIKKRNGSQSCSDIASEIK